MLFNFTLDLFEWLNRKEFWHQKKNALNRSLYQLKLFSVQVDVSFHGCIQCKLSYLHLISRDNVRFVSFLLPMQSPLIYFIIKYSLRVKKRKYANLYLFRLDIHYYEAHSRRKSTEYMSFEFDSLYPVTLGRIHFVAVASGSDCGCFINYGKENFTYHFLVSFTLFMHICVRPFGHSIWSWSTEHLLNLSYNCLAHYRISKAYESDTCDFSPKQNLYWITSHQIHLSISILFSFCSQFIVLSLFICFLSIYLFLYWFCFFYTSNWTGAGDKSL